LSQAPGRVHVLIDADQICRWAEELDVPGQVASRCIEVVIGPGLEMSPGEGNSRRLRS
jgi:hypothetical protein